MEKEMITYLDKYACFLFLLCCLLIQNVQSIGVNYGTLGNNLPPPAKVARFLKDKTIIDRVKLFDANPEIVSAFANTGMFVTITVPNGEIPSLTSVDYASEWIKKNIKPHYPATKISYICIGNEVLHWGPQNLIDNLVSAMKSMNQALVSLSMGDIKVCAAQSLSILEPIPNNAPPSLARFRAGWDVGVLTPMLQYHNETKSPFIVNPYPYFGYSKEMEDFALFKENKTVVFDPETKKSYDNMFDLLLDSVYMSMIKLGFKDVDIVVGETGWPSLGASNEVHISLANAAAYNGGLLNKVSSGKGTPLMPDKKFEIYIFGLFNENEKPGPIPERNFGLFWPDFSEVYKIGIMKSQPSTPETPEVPEAPEQPTPPGQANQTPPGQANQTSPGQANQTPPGQANQPSPIGQEPPKGSDDQKPEPTSPEGAKNINQHQSGGTHELPNIVRGALSVILLALVL